MTKASTRILCVVLLSLTFTGCGTSSNLHKTGSSLLTSLGSSPNLSQFTSLSQTPWIDKLLGSSLKEPFTLLAPTNDAISSPGSSAGNLGTDINKLASMVKDQIVPRKLDAAGLAQSGLKTAGGKALDFGNAQLGNAISGDKFNIIPVSKVLGS